MEPFQAAGGYAGYRIVSNPAVTTGNDLGPAIYDLARAHDWPVRELRPDVRTLESVFNELATTAGTGEVIR